MGPSEAMVRATVDAMVGGGFVAAGYRYLNLDDGIVEVDRDANGDLVADKKGFPNGFKGKCASRRALGRLAPDSLTRPALSRCALAAVVADYVHANGMLFGVYTDRGTNTCGGRAGALGHEVADANFYARNGFE
jgi:alpha-galactosidase